MYDARRANAVDLVQLPASIPGTRCGNCAHFSAAGAYCSHPEVRMNVQPDWCCNEWSRHDAPRAKPRAQAKGRRRYRRILEAAVSRLARAGDPDDCGHEPKGGYFTIKNTCGGRRRGGTAARRPRRRAAPRPAMAPPATTPAPASSPPATPQAASQGPPRGRGDIADRIRAKLVEHGAARLWPHLDDQEKAYLSSSIAVKVASGLTGVMEQRGKDLSRGKGYAFYSPNVEEDTKFDYAAKMLRSDRQKAARQQSDSIDAKLGLRSQSYDAIGDWADGAENSVVSSYEGITDFNKLREAAARKGLAWNQKAVIPFVADRDGPDVMYEIDVAGDDLHDIRDRLGKAGIQFRSLVPGRGKTRVYVFDSGDQLADNIEKFGATYGEGQISGRSYRGRGEFLGHDTRTGARRAYIEAIRQAKGEVAVGRYRKGGQIRQGVDHRRGAGSRRRGLIGRAIARFAARKKKAGDADDCGHEREGGEFTRENTCAALKGGRTDIPAGLRKLKLSDSDLPEAYRGKLTEAELAEIGTGDAYRRFLKLANASVLNNRGYLPVADELRALAKMGESVRGQYEYGGRFIEAAFGPGMKEIWAAANSIMSANMDWVRHTLASLRIMTAWFDADMPAGDSPESARKIDDLLEKIHRMTDPDTGLRSHQMTGDKKRKLARLLAESGNVRDELIANAGTGKTVNFAQAWSSPKGTPIDKWMSDLLVPDSVFPEGASDRLAELVRVDTQGFRKAGVSPEMRLTLEALRGARKAIMQDPVARNAYKVSIGHVADQLGWEPREVQEAVWASTMAIGLLKAGGVEDDKLIKSLTHDLIKQSWDMEGMFGGKLGEEIGKQLREPGVLGTLASWAERTTAPRRARTGQAHHVLTPPEREAAEEAARKIGVAGTATRVGKTLYEPDESGGVRVRKRWRRVRGVARHILARARA